MRLLLHCCSAAVDGQGFHRRYWNIPAVSQDSKLSAQVYANTHWSYAATEYLIFLSVGNSKQRGGAEASVRHGSNAVTASQALGLYCRC